MAHGHTYLAIDLGAESGRAIVAGLDGDKLTLSEAHRFANGPVLLPDGMHWDVLRLWAEIKTGITATVRDGQKLDGIGVDTWGVDFALLGRDGGLLGNPTHYRDARTDGMFDEAFRRMPRAEVFAQTGIQFMQLNTLYQLLAMAIAKSPQMEVAETFVTIPDLLNFWLSGRIGNEFTNATTTQCFDPVRREWAAPLLDAMGIPRKIFQPIIEPGTNLGTLLPYVAEETGAGPVPIIVPACHDTGSAVVAVPASGADFAWISSGTWSVMGAEAKRPNVSEKALAYNFTNEGGVFGTWRLSKNVMGLWLVQECRRTWAHQGRDYSYDDLTRQASEAEPFLAVIDPDDGSFFNPGDMPTRIRDFCKRTGQKAPETTGQIVRLALEGLALKYRLVLERLEELTATHLDTIHIFGGGSQNQLLDQMAADASGRTVVTGPVEATAIGNVLMQAIALGHLGSLADARAVVRASFTPRTFQPASKDGWDAAYARLLELMK